MISYKHQQLNHTLNELPEWNKVKEGVYEIKQDKVKQMENENKTLKQQAQNYEAANMIKNITEIEKVPVDVELFDGQGKNAEGEIFKYKFAKIGDDSVRIPGSVIGQLKEILKKMPNLKFITVTKQGTGLATKYIVMPYHVEEQV